MWRFIKSYYMKSFIAIAFLLCISSLEADGQQNQSSKSERPTFPERVDPTTLHRDSLKRLPKSTPSDARIIAEPAKEQPATIQNDSLKFKRNSRRKEQD